MAAAAASASSAALSRAAFGAGCFWGTQKFFKKEFGDKLARTAVGYMGGDDSKKKKKKSGSPTYEDVCTGTTGHAEVIYVEFDESLVSYKSLVQLFFRMHDPTTKNRQGNDRGTQYRSAIFYYSPEQKAVAEAVMDVVQKHYKSEKKKDVVTTLETAEGQTFHEGEDYHQDYLDKNPGGYCNHRLYLEPNIFDDVDE